MGEPITATKDRHKDRQRKRIARKTIQQQSNKDVSAPTRIQPLTEKERKLTKQYAIFLIRNLNKAQRIWKKNQKECKIPIGTPNANKANATDVSTLVHIMQRRNSTATSQISPSTQRQIKTRGVTLFAHDTEVEKYTNLAKIFRNICTALEQTKYPNLSQENILTAIRETYRTYVGANKRKISAFLPVKHRFTDIKDIQANIESGYYKLPSEFNDDVLQMFKNIKQFLLETSNKENKLKMLEYLENCFDEQKQKQYEALREIVEDEKLVDDYKKRQGNENVSNTNSTLDNSNTIKSNSSTVNINESNESSILVNQTLNMTTTTEDIIRCICGLFKDEGLMIQCSCCMVWQHTECTKADINAENYLCEKCEPRQVDYEIPLDEFTEEGHRYYLTLMRGRDLQVRQGDAVYVLRDIPIKDETGNILPTKKHTYETIGKIDYNECDIFRVERLWKDEEGKRLIFGHHFLRPHETFHEPSRKFYPNEVVRVPLYEVVPIELVIGRCWVLDRTTFCKGRPMECTDEAHCFICELRVDKQARFFSKAKNNYPLCTKSYAFRKFEQKLRISKTYAPHEVDPTHLKTKRTKIEPERNTNDSNSTLTTTTNVEKVYVSLTKGTTKKGIPKKDLSFLPSSYGIHKKQIVHSPTLVTKLHTNLKSLRNHKQKRFRLENILKAIKQNYAAGKWIDSELSINITSLLNNRGTRQRKTLTHTSTTN